MVFTRSLKLQSRSSITASMSLMFASDRRMDIRWEVLSGSHPANILGRNDSMSPCFMREIMSCLANALGWVVSLASDTATKRR